MNILHKARVLKILLAILLILSGIGNAIAQASKEEFGTGHMITQAPKEEFKPSGKIWGYAFGDFFIKTGGDTATWASRAEYSGVPKKVYAFSFRRIYLGYDYNISPAFSAQALLEGSDVVLTAHGERSLLIKALYLKWKNLYKGADFLIGQMPTISYAMFYDQLWNYRSIEKSLLDMRGIRPSSDMGVALYGRFDSLETYGYHFMISNGTGTKPEDLSQPGKHIDYAADVFGYFFKRKFILDLYADFQSEPNNHHVTILKIFGVYQTEPFTFGMELLTQSQNNIKSDGTDATPFGYSVFARGRIVKDKLNAFARYDSFNPDNSYRDIDAPGVYDSATMYLHYNEQFFTAGLDFMPHKNVHIMPNIWINSYTPKANATLLVKRVADVVPRLTFYFIFK